LEFFIGGIERDQQDPWQETNNAATDGEVRMHRDAEEAATPSKDDEQRRTEDCPRNRLS
jgi:hypothetical protein